MNQDDIIRIAQVADDYADMKLGKGEFHPGWHDVRDKKFAELVAAAVSEDNIIKRNAVRDELTMSRFDFIRLREADRALARAAEREKCAKKCESYIATEIGKEMADAIRAMENE